MTPLFRSSFAVLLFASLPLVVNAQEVGQDVKPDHWAFDAVQDLATKGLIKGYPPDGRFLGNRTLTRYEMATILKRVIDRMEELIKAVPASGATKEEVAQLKADQDKLKSSLDEINRLISEFKTQLTVIGTDMEQVKKDLMTLREQVGALGTRVDGLDARINSLTGKVDQANMKADKALSDLNQFKTQTNAALAKKVDVGVGKLRVGGIIQTWYGTAFGDTLGGNNGAMGNTKGGNFGPVPPGRTFGGGVGDTFRIRRGEVQVIGSITPKVDFRIMFDLAKTGTGATAPLQDIWVGYQLGRNVRVEIGAQKPALSEEAIRSPGELLTVERSIMNTLPGTVGQIGSLRDTGAALKYKGTLGSVTLGIWNDNGPAENSVDNDRFKFATATAFFTGIRHLTLGVWGGTNLGDFKPANARDRAGATIIWQSGPHYFEAEGGYAHDHTGTSPINFRTIGLGGYVLYAHSLSKTWQLVARYDEWDPAIHGGIPATGTPASIPFKDHNLKEYTVGVNYYMRSHNAKIQANYIIDDVQSNGTGFFGARRQLLLTNYQVFY